MSVTSEADFSAWDVSFSPADFEGLARRDLSGAVCIVFDVLRATSTILTALSNGATAILPVRTIEEALSCHGRDPSVMLAGERGGVRITQAVSGGAAFDFGNSPREFLRDRVEGRRIVMTTTNGTRAIKACEKASRVFVGALLNRAALVRRIRLLKPARLLLVCSGTGEEIAMEDVLGAGALAYALQADAGTCVGDGWRVAANLYTSSKPDLLGALTATKNGLRLAGMPSLAPDLEVCSAIDSLDLIGELNAFGELRVSGAPG